jgi:hypothetical protein
MEWNAYLRATTRTMDNVTAARSFALHVLTAGRALEFYCTHESLLFQFHAAKNSSLYRHLRRIEFQAP